jgi:hypothetical protein
MPLTREQFNELRSKGLSVEQIIKFEKRQPTQKQPEQKLKRPEPSLLQKADTLAQNTFGRASDFLFGSTAKSVGGLITSGIGGVRSLTADTPEELAHGKRLEKIGEEAITAGNTAFTALELFPGGGVLSGMLKKTAAGEKMADGINKIVKALPEGLRGQAIDQYKQVLGATTKKFKEISEKVAPELSERGVTAFTRGGLEKKASKMTSETGEQIDEFIGNIPKGTSLKTEPIITAIEETKKGFTIKGVVVEPEKLKVADDLIEVVKQFGDELEAENVIALRRVWDETINAAGKGFGLAERDAFKLKVKKIATNSIRKELGKEFPDLAKLNKEFSFWKGVKDVVKETEKRIAGKPSFAEGQAGRLGAAGGFVKDGVSSAIYVGIAAKNLTKLFKSTAWLTMSAQQKLKLANLIEKGDVFAVSEFARRGAAGVKNISDEE